MLKKTPSSLKKWPLNLSWLSNKTIIVVGNVTKAAIFKSFYLSYKNTQILFLWTVLFNIFMRQTLINDFWGLHKKMNCAFPLMMFECIFGFDILRKFSFNHLLLFKLSSTGLWIVQVWSINYTLCFRYRNIVFIRLYLALAY